VLFEFLNRGEQHFKSPTRDEWRFNDSLVLALAQVFQEGFIKTILIE
jgi:hypothetical protein